MELERFKSIFEAHLAKSLSPKEPKGLYEPISYILSLGGKRIRPCVTLMATELCGSAAEEGLAAAMAVEMFHNFTLIHDDIMDQAEKRRGQPTVHTRWDENTGILSGDALMIKSYEQFESYEPSVFKSLIKLFNKTALEVCEGQQWDMEFESETEVSMDRYFKMIQYKTAVLLGAAFQMGAIVAKADLANQKNLYQFGLKLGTAFQLQDDYLDTFGTEDFGKKIGGDILEGKKTFLYIETMEKADAEDKEKLLALYDQDDRNDALIAEVKDLFAKYGSPESLNQAIEQYTIEALDHLSALEVSEKGKDMLKGLAAYLMHRAI